jgi:WD40 repeat protein
MRTRLVLTLVLTILPAAHALAGKPRTLAPSGELELSARGKLQYWKACPAASLVVATVARSTALYTIDVKTSQATLVQDLPRGHEFAFSADCGLLALGESDGEDRTASIWRVAPSGKAERLATLGKNRYPVSAVALTADARRVLVATNGGDLQVWQLDVDKRSATQLSARTLVGDGKGSDLVMDLAVDRDRVLVGLFRGGVLLVSLDAAGAVSATTPLLGDHAAHREQGSMNATTGEVTMFGGGRVFSVAFLDGGATALAFSESGELRTWSVPPGGKPGAATVVFKADKGQSELALSADGRQLVMWGGGLAQVVDLPAGGKGKKRVQLSGLDTIEGYPATSGAQFVGPGQLLVGGFTTAKLRLHVIK